MASKRDRCFIHQLVEAKGSKRVGHHVYRLCAPCLAAETMPTRPDPQAVRDQGIEAMNKYMGALQS